MRGVGGRAAKILTLPCKLHQEEQHAQELKSSQRLTQSQSPCLHSPPSLVSLQLPCPAREVSKGMGCRRYGGGALNDIQEVNLATVSHLMEASNFS